jgi:hypothetical protein
MNRKVSRHLLKHVLKALLIIILLFQVKWAESQDCSYTLSMHDSYGDGWNGGYLSVFVNDELIGNFYASNLGSTETFEVTDGDLLELFYTAGDYENENSYQLYDPAWNFLFGDGPNPQTGNVYSSTSDCNGLMLPGNHPCTAVEIDTGCVVADNTGYPGSGFNAGCANYQGADIWFTMPVPPSGNLSFITSNGGLTDTGLGVWTGSTCTDIHCLGCDDDTGNDYYSMLSLYDLTPGERLYIQVWGYGGGTGSFQLCASDLGTVVLDSTELPIVMINTLGQTIVENTKIDALMDIKYNGLGSITYVSDSSNVYSGNIGIEIRGATSAGYPQHPYSIETRTPEGENNNVPLLGMPAENDWLLLSNYNDRSLIRNTLAYKLFEEMGNYSVRTNLCEVLIDSAYKGIYVFCEKIKQDNDRVDIAKLTTADTVGDDLTGGYILEQNYWNETNSFLSNYSPIDHPDFDVHFVYYYPKPDEILPVQKSYIAAFVDSLESALYSTGFTDPDTGYRKYLDVDSFIDYFLVNELSRNNDGFKKSVYFYKDKNSNESKLKAGPVWDFDWAWKNMYGCSIFESLDGSGWAHHINDCPTDNYSCGWYIRLFQDTTFTDELRCAYDNYRLTILDTTHIFAYIDSVRSLVQNAQARHFRKWPILGISGPAPEVGNVATTYNGELDTLKAWISLRLQWLDENIPGFCPNVSIDEGRQDLFSTLRYYPNPGNGDFHFEGYINGSDPLQMTVFDLAGRMIDQLSIQPGNLRFDYRLSRKGVFFFNITNNNGLQRSGKLIVL